MRAKIQDSPGSYIRIWSDKKECVLGIGRKGLLPCINLFFWSPFKLRTLIKHLQKSLDLMEARQKEVSDEQG